MVAGLVREQVCGGHVGVADDVDVLDSVDLRQGVEFGEEAIEQVRDL